MRSRALERSRLYDVEKVLDKKLIEDLGMNARVY